MKDEFSPSGSFKIICGILILAGLTGMAVGFINNPDRTWANFLLSNYYFFSISMGALFFFGIQSISQSGWSAAFKRIPEAMMLYVPVAGLIFLLLYFGLHNLYHWSHAEEVAIDPILQHKSPYLNTPFFMIRMIVSVGLWTWLILKLRQFSRNEDNEPGLKWFERTEFYSKALIFVLAITFSMTTIDWIMSLDPHWYSTIFALKNMVAAFLHGVSIIVLIIWILHRKGYFSFLNKYHLHDFSRYLFMLAIVWGYFWFAQFMIIWYGNIPEETVYYYIRWKDGWYVFFFLEIILNWGIPFLLLMPVKASRNFSVIMIVVVILIIGQYLDLYVQIMPGILDKPSFGYIEILTWAGFLGLFMLVTIVSLGKQKLVPVNHPYLEESLEHHF